MSFKDIGQYCYICFCGNCLVSNLVQHIYINRCGNIEKKARTFSTVQMKVEEFEISRGAELTRHPRLDPGGTPLHRRDARQGPFLGTM